jgi:hypothetical protein
MIRLLAGGLVLAALVAPTAARAADDKDTGTWVRKVDCIELKFEIAKDTGKFSVTLGSDAMIVTGKLKRDKDTIEVEVTDVEFKGNANNGPKKGDKVSFKWVVKGDKATLSDLKGDGADDAKAIVEGEYKKQ